ncbi:MAG TPA: hypothetical protein PLO67_03445 [Saprospiraceae bacterium]|nr:hypothetical protein [Saprospiraceae bacterium]HPI06330.1 hypothetical protein [Saprospiraceae bacterium]
MAILLLPQQVYKRTDLAVCGLSKIFLRKIAGVKKKYISHVLSIFATLFLLHVNAGKQAAGAKVFF